MGKKRTSEFYVDKALENIIEDRERLTKLYDVLDEATSELDQMAKIAVSDNLVKIVDSLTKQNGQVVELAKLKQKSETPVKGPEKGGPVGIFGDEEHEEIYNAISGGSSSDDYDYDA